MAGNVSSNNGRGEPRPRESTIAPARLLLPRPLAVARPEGRVTSPRLRLIGSHRVFDFT